MTVDVKVNIEHSINWHLAKWTRTLDLQDDRALVAHIKSVISVCHIIPRANRYSINPSICAVNNLVFCESHEVASDLGVTTCCTSVSSLNPAVVDYLIANAFVKTKQFIFAFSRKYSFCLGLGKIETVRFIVEFYGIVKNVLNVSISEAQVGLEKGLLWVTDEPLSTNSLVYHCNKRGSKVRTEIMVAATE